MKNKSILSAGLLFLSLATNHASAVDFSIGGGWPFLVVPEVSIASDDTTQRGYINYKMGLDDGFALGFEQGLDQENHHAIGAFVGALGVQDKNTACPEEQSDDLVESLGSVFGCSLLIIFDEETTNGLGLSYSYNANGLNNAGLRIRFELGYGEGSSSHEKRVDGGFVISYQF